VLEIQLRKGENKCNLSPTYMNSSKDQSFTSYRTGYLEHIIHISHSILLPVKHMLMWPYSTYHHCFFPYWSSMLLLCIIYWDTTELCCNIHINTVFSVKFGGWKMYIITIQFYCNALRTKSLTTNYMKVIKQNKLIHNSNTLILVSTRWKKNLRSSKVDCSLTEMLKDAAMG
jgi:hypothetical protein